MRDAWTKAAGDHADAVVAVADHDGVGAAKVLDVVGGVVVGDELQRVGDALNEVGIADHGNH